MELRVAAAKSKRILRTKIRCNNFFFYKKLDGNIFLRNVYTKVYSRKFTCLRKWSSGMFRCMVIGAGLLFFLEG